MNWYVQSSENSDVVRSTRIRFARNLAQFKFNLEKPGVSATKPFITFISST